MCANWVNNRDMSPARDGNDRYQLDNEGLQIGLGLPIQLLGVAALMNEPDRNNMFRRSSNRPNGKRGRGGPRRNQYSRNQMRKAEVQETYDGVPIRKLYVVNISIEMQPQDLHYIFGSYGTVYHIFMRVANNNNSKFAFVTYVDPLHAAQVLQMRRIKDIYERPMYINAADSWHQPVEMPDGTMDWRVRPTRQEECQEQEEDQPSEETVSRVETEINEGSLNKLNDDCLLHIFSFLSLKEITGVERVCKRWQALSYRMWHCLHELKFSRGSPFDSIFCTTKLLRQYLKRCGSSLTTLVINNKKHNFDKTALSVIASYCENLEILQMSDLPVAKRSLAHLGRTCPKLKQLSINACDNVTDEELNPLLSKCPNLSVLVLSKLRKLTGKCLARIIGPIKSLHLKELQNLHPDLLLSGLEKMSPTLESLSFNHDRIHRVENNTFIFTRIDDIVKAVPNLTCFSLTNYEAVFMNISSTVLAPLAQLKMLTTLNLCHSKPVSDKILSDIVEGCEQLITVNLCGSGNEDNPTETGIATLARLKQLRHLTLSYLDATTNTALKNFTSRHCKLKTLECRGCPRLGDEGAEMVVTLCNDLELFDVSGCEEITESTSETAATSVKMRTNNTPLRMIVGGTDICESPALQVPLFTIDFRDLSEDHLRPDFIDNMFFPSSDDDDTDDDLEHLCAHIAYVFGEYPNMMGFNSDDDFFITDDDGDTLSEDSEVSQDF